MPRPFRGWKFRPTAGGTKRCTVSRATEKPQSFRKPSAWRPPGIADLEHRIGDIIATEVARKYNDAIRRNGFARQYEGLTFWSPNINIFRDPRWGRGQETYGEDPYLTGRIGVAFIRGMQGERSALF